MGYFSSSSTSETSIPDPTPEEQGLMNMMTDGLMTSYLDEAGYDVQKTETTWEASDTYSDIQTRRTNIQQQIDTLSSTRRTTLDPTGTATSNQLTSLNRQLNGLTAEENSKREEFKPEITYETRRKSDLAVENLRDPNLPEDQQSQEYKDAKAAYEGEAATREEQGQKITGLAMDQAEKFLKGDYTLNADQEKWVTDTLGPIKEAGLNAIKYLKDEATASEKGIMGSIDAFAEEVKKTGMKMEDAIVELEDRTRTTGANMKVALEDSLAQSRAMTEMGINDFSLNTRKAISAKAASLGRSPTDPAFVAEMTEQVTKEIQRTGLAYGQMSAEGRMGIEERTGAGLESASKLRGQVAERTGAGLESAAQMRIGTQERTAGVMEEASRMKGTQEVGLAEAGANLRKDIGMGQVPGTVGFGLDVNRYNQAISQVQMQNAGAAMNAVAMPVSWYQSDRQAQPSVTTTSTPSIASSIGGLIRTGASLAATGAGGGFGSAVSGLFK